MTISKQHYSFIFENPENNIPSTEWNSIFSKNKLKKDDLEKDKEEDNASNKASLTERFFGIVEALMKLG